jgi:hypothetical protein
MNRNHFRTLARIRLREARVLIESGCFDGGYYLSGYAVECALKACIAKQTRRHDFPDKERVSKSYSHDLGKLVEVAGLRVLLDQEQQRNPPFSAKWNTLKDWSAERRYTLNSRREAYVLYRAITARQNGVMQWLRQYW